MNEKLRWGIIGLGWIAEHFANGLRGCRTGELTAVASRSLDNARQFAARHGGARAHGSYEQLVSDPDVQIVYVATPHSMHAEWSVRAAEAGKHVLCEKPLALDHAEAQAVIHAVRPLNVFFMEAFMYRIHPQTLKLIELLRQRAIGDVWMIQSTHSFRADYDPAHRLFDASLGGGAILDVGCYDVSVSRLIAGVAAGGELAEPIHVAGCAHLDEHGVDHWAAGTLKFENDVVAQMATSIRCDQDNTLRIDGSEGSIHVPSPWHCTGFDGGRSQIVVHRIDKDRQTIAFAIPQNLYGIEADFVAEHVHKTEAPWPAPTWEDSLANMRVVDKWLEAVKP